VATATSKSKPAWQAKVTAKTFEITQQFVDLSHPGGAEFRFRVDRRKGQPLTFTDFREPGTGTAGTTGIWGTRPPQPAGRSCSLTPTSFRYELAALVGAKRAAEIIESLTEVGQSAHPHG